MRDPASGYASADVLDPAAEVNRDHSGEGEELQDAMSGYASIDALDPAAEVNHHVRADEEPENLQDPMSGYASADLLDPAPPRDARRS